MSFVIAEVGSNFTSLQDCLHSIQVASDAGANAVKFQMFTHREMFGYGSDENLSIKPEWLPNLRIMADACNVELMCTAFSPEGLSLIDPFVLRHKIASSDVSNVPLLKAANATRKPVILSTGAQSEVDLGLALCHLPGAKLTLTYCVSNYPASNANLYGIERLRNLFGYNPSEPHTASRDVSFGYSCHALGYMECVYAVKKFGAEVIEKHFKLRDMETADAPHSLEPSEFRKMVKLLGNPYPSMPDPQERQMVLRHKRRLMAVKPIEVGEKLRFGENYGIFRSKEDDTKGLSGFAYEAVNGKIAARPLNEGEPIGPGDFK